MPRQNARSKGSVFGYQLPRLPMKTPDRSHPENWSLDQIDAVKVAFREYMGWQPFRDGAPRPRRGLPKNVVGIGFGCKWTAQKRVALNCLRVYVQFKKPARDIPRHQRVPAAFQGIPIDVIAVGPIP